MRRLVLAVALLAASCGTTSVTLEPTSTTVAAAALAPTSTTTTTTTMPPSTTDAPEPTFTGSSRPTDVAELGDSWRDGCPVAVDELRWVELTHWDYDGNATSGVLVLHADHVDDVIAVFGRLFEARFPVESMQPITAFGGDDNASMRANNSSAFNCRVIDGTTRWSQHAYGGAIDINPLVNPWVRGDRVDPPEGAAYVERDPAVPGLIVAGDIVTEAFAAIGWRWGGDWDNTLDYQHFSHDGR